MTTAYIPCLPHMSVLRELCKLFTLKIYDRKVKKNTVK